MMVLGIDLGGSKLLACATDADGRVQLRLRRPTGRGFGPTAAIEAIEEIAARARELGPLAAVGIGFPGLVDHRRGIARSTTMLDGWHDVPLAAMMTAALDLPCVLHNDVNAAAFHEHAQRSAHDLLYVAVGTGIGGALVLGGELWCGTSGFAGELGHVSIDRAGPVCVCGRRGCVNIYASGPAIEDAAGLARGTLATVAGAATLPAVAAGATALGVALGSALNVLDVPLVVLGGGVAELGQPYIGAVAARARRECFREIGDRCTFEAAAGGYDASALGAALLARQLVSRGDHPRAVATRSS